MADALTVELVAADRMVWSGEATMVIARTVEGDLGVRSSAGAVVDSPADAPIVRLMQEALTRADPEAVALPMMITLGTDGKAMARLGTPTYGFTPLRLDPDQPLLSLYHANDERIPVSALRFGLPVLYEVVRRFSATEGE